MHKHFLHSSFDLGNTWIFARWHRNKHCTEFFRDHIVLPNPWWHICDSGDDSDTFYQHYPQVFLFDTLWSHLICVVTENSFLWKKKRLFFQLTCLLDTNNRNSKYLEHFDSSTSSLKCSRSLIRSYWGALRRLDPPFRPLLVRPRSSSRNWPDLDHRRLFLFYFLVQRNSLHCLNSFLVLNRARSFVDFLLDSPTSTDWSIHWKYLQPFPSDNFKFLARIIIELYYISSSGTHDGQNFS